MTFVATAIVLAFFVDVWSKLQEKTVKKRRVLSRVFLFFATWRTLKFIAMRSVYSTFHFFVFCVFFPTNAAKIRLKNGPAKVLVTALREAILGPKNPLKSYPGEAQNRKNLEKIGFGGA